MQNKSNPEERNSKKYDTGGPYPCSYLHKLCRDGGKLFRFKKRDSLLIAT